LGYDRIIKSIVYDRILVWIAFKNLKQIWQWQINKINK